ncbi:hypothetical protein C8R44DRAFT_868723 [Mycena epipterygia]|nr:hypothetical protein C8R44DRAFT_868723 [Mycena epipterygia]
MEYHLSDQPKLSRPSFLDLPDAVVLRLCQYLPDTSIHAASLSCRTLNHIALDSFLARHGIIEPALECLVVLDGFDHDGRLNLLHALNLATSFQSTESLSLIFLNADLSLVSRDLVRCLGLMHRLSPLRDVCIEFRSTVYASETGPNQWDGKIQKEWNSSVAELWIAVLQNPSVTSLKVRTQWAFVQNYKNYTSVTSMFGSRRLGGIKTRLVRTLRNKRDTTIFTRRALSELPLGRCTITTLDVDSELLLLPPIYQLIVLTMQHSPITSLGLHNAVLSPGQWFRVFTDIVAAVPDLTELEITQTDIAPEPLCRFLCRLPQLARLTIKPYYGSTTHPPPTVRDIPQFPHLTKLSLHTDYLAIFLRRPDALPRAESLDIAMSIRDLIVPSILPDLSLIHRHSTLDITLHVDGFSFLYSPTDAMDCCIDFALAMGAKWGQVFGRVQALVLRNLCCSVVDSPEFSRWLTLFPMLKTVSWTDDYCDMGPMHIFTREIARKVTAAFIPEDIVAAGQSSQIWSGNTLIPTSAKTRFLDFPDDILLTLFEYLLSTELFDLSLVSRRLNVLALPVYLDREGIFDRSTGKYTVMLWDRPEARDSLAALTITLFPPHPTSFSCCYIRRPLHAYPVYPAINHLRRLISFVQRLSSIDEVSLHFGVSSTILRRSEEYDPLQHRWCSLFEELLNVIVAKSCTSLSVQGSPYLFPAAEPWKERILEEHQKTVTLSPPLRTDVTMFSFEPTSLLSPVFMPWTIPVIQHSQLTSIGIFISAEDEHCLKILADTIPHLRVLEIREQSSGQKLLPISLIFGLLARLPMLQTLRIFDLYLNTDDVPTSAPHLPHLKVLTGTDHYVRKLLCANNPLPSLQFLEIHVCLSSGFSFDENLGRTSLSSIFMNLRRFNLAPTVALTVEFFSFQVDATWPLGAFDAMLGADWLDWCSCISTLKLEVKWRLVPTWSYSQDVGMYLTILTQRLYRFSALSDISFNDGPHASEPSGVEASRTELIMQAIQRGLPHIQKIQVNGKECKGY